jgi:hypothetical protein
MTADGFRVLGNDGFKDRSIYCHSCGRIHLKVTGQQHPGESA